MELTMAAQEDSSPWDVPPAIQVQDRNAAVEAEVALHGRGYFSELGKSRSCCAHKFVNKSAEAHTSPQESSAASPPAPTHPQRCQNPAQIRSLSSRVLPSSPPWYPY